MSTANSLQGLDANERFFVTRILSSADQEDASHTAAASDSSIRGFTQTVLTDQRLSKTERRAAILNLVSVNEGVIGPIVQDEINQMTAHARTFVEGEVQYNVDAILTNGEMSDTQRKGAFTALIAQEPSIVASIVMDEAQNLFRTSLGKIIGQIKEQEVAFSANAGTDDKRYAFLNMLATEHASVDDVVQRDVGAIMQTPISSEMKKHELTELFNVDPSIRTLISNEIKGFLPKVAPIEEANPTQLQQPDTSRKGQSIVRRSQTPSFRQQ